MVCGFLSLTTSSVSTTGFMISASHRYSLHILVRALPNDNLHSTFVTDYCINTVEILPYGIRARGFALMVCFRLYLNPSVTERSLEHDCPIYFSLQSICEPMGSQCHRLEICEVLIHLV